MHELALAGCRTAPLASYLKGLGVFRLVAEQAGANVKGWWSRNTFHIRSSLTAEDLRHFFLKAYAPTPIVAPWNGGSGFYAGDSATGIDAITASTDERFASYRAIILQIRGWPEMPRVFTTVQDVVSALRLAGEKIAAGTKKSDWEKLLSDEATARREAASDLRTFADLGTNVDRLERESKALTGNEKKSASRWWKTVKKLRTKCLELERGSGKETLLNACRARLPAACMAWLDAAYAIRVDSTASYNPLLGTGGNEGRLDFTNNFMQRISELLLTGDPTQSRALLQGSIFAAPVAGLPKASIGQFDPGRAGGYNQGAAIETNDFKINPWDFVLMLEGAATLASSVCRRSLCDARGYGSFPFTVDLSGIGFASSEHTEKGRGESWLPIWKQPAGYAEVRHLFGEGRGSVGRRDARSGLDFTRAVGSLGVDRGIDHFMRFVFLERRGTNYVALPAGRIPVRFEPSLRLLDDLDPILARVDGFLRAFKKMPATFESARRRIDDALYSVTLAPTHERFAGLVRALGRMEFLIAQRDRSKKPGLSRPLSGLRPQWILQCDDGAVEVRIAAALASIRRTGDVGSIRANLAGVDAQKPWMWARGRGQRRWYGNGLAERLAGVLVQRLMDAERLSVDSIPIEARVQVSPREVVPFLYGVTDDELLEELFWGCTLMDWSDKDGLRGISDHWRQVSVTGPLPRGWCAIKLLYLPGTIREKRVRREPRIPSLLTSNRGRAAVAIARSRLWSHGLAPLPVYHDEHISAQRQLAALLIPTRDQWMLERLVLGENTGANGNKENA